MSHLGNILFFVFSRTSETVFLTSLERFKSDMPRILASRRIGRMFSGKFLRGIVYSNDGSLFRASFDGSLREAIEGLDLSTPIERNNNLV